MTIPEVNTYASDGSGRRLSAFALGRLRVSVQPMDPEDNEAAFALACQLARSEAEVVQLTADLGACRAQVREQKRPPAKLLGKGFVRFSATGIYILNRRERGFGEFGYRCDSWDELFRDFDVCVTGHGEDEHGPWWSVEST